MNVRNLDEISTGENQNALELKVLMVFEDTWAGLCAKRALDDLPLPAEPEPAYKLRLWRWELLRDPLLKERAVEEAANADVIMVCGHGRSELPLEIRDWLSRWLIRKEARPYAIGLIVDNVPSIDGTIDQMRRFVRAMAQAGNADFFYRPSGMGQNSEMDAHANHGAEYEYARN